MRKYTKQPVGERFLGKVNPKSSGCHEWTAAIGVGGYGMFKLDRKMQYAHRVAWELANGPIPDGMFVLHRCDNRICVNPEHLFLGTKSDNSVDMIAKGRNGIKTQRNKLTDAERVMVENLKYSGMSQVKVGKMFGVSQGAIGYIWSRIE